jgi:hypothetical protein
MCEQLVNLIGHYRDQSLPTKHAAQGLTGQGALPCHSEVFPSHRPAQGPSRAFWRVDGGCRGVMAELTTAHEPFPRVSSMLPMSALHGIKPPMTTRAKKPTKPTGSEKNRRPTEKANSPHSKQQRAAIASARKCWNCMKRQPVGVAGSKLLAYHIIGKCLLEASHADRRASYGQELVPTFTAEWAQLGGFKLGQAGAKYCKLLAAAFDKDLLLKAIAAGLTWTDLRRLSSKAVSAQERQNEVGKRLKAKTHS